MQTVEQQRALCDRLRAEMHSVPMNPIFTTHTGHKFLGNHSNAWARTSQAWCDAVAELRKMENTNADA